MNRSLPAEFAGNKLRGDFRKLLRYHAPRTRQPGLIPLAGIQSSTGLPIRERAAICKDRARLLSSKN